MDHQNYRYPGKFIQEIYMIPFKLSIRQLSEMLCLSPSALTRLLDGETKITPELAHRLSKNLGRTPESWLSMQEEYDLWQERQKADNAKKRVT